MQQVEKIAEKGAELREEWDEEKEELKDEYGAEIEEQEATSFRFSIKGEKYRSDWGADEVFDWDGDYAEGDAADFAEGYTDLYQSKLGELGELIEEETDFVPISHDETGQKYEGTSFYSRFRIWMPHLPTRPEQIRIFYMKQEHIGNADEIREELEEKGVLDEEGEE